MARVAVVKTSPYWPFSSLNRAPYYLATRAFVELSKRFPEINSVYLRHGLIQGDWVPAISDIDLTLIIDSSLTIDEEFSFLRNFWKNYDRLKKLFPMLGEVEILNEQHIGSWTKLTIRGYESRQWKLIYGRETVSTNYVGAATTLATDSLNYGLWQYLDFFLKRKFYLQHPSYLASQEMQRLVFKILRYANYAELNNERRNSNKQLGDKIQMLCCIIRGLEKGIRSLAPPRAPVDSRQDAGAWLNAFGFRNVFLKDEALDLREFAPSHEAIVGIFLAHNTNITVLRDGLDTTTMRNCTEAVSRVFARQGATPVIVSLCVFKYMLRVYDPFLYTHLIMCRRVVYGKDVLPEIQPPRLRSFVDRMLDQTTTVLTFPQSRALVSPPGPSWFSGRVLDSIVERALAIKLYLEKGITRPWYDELLSESRSRYPQCWDRLRALQHQSAYVTVETSSLQAFRLLKSIANDIHTCMADSGITGRYDGNAEPIRAKSRKTETICL